MSAAGRVLLAFSRPAESGGLATALAEKKRQMGRLWEERAGEWVGAN